VIGKVPANRGDGARKNEQGVSGSPGIPPCLERRCGGVPGYRHGARIALVIACPEAEAVLIDSDLGILRRRHGKPAKRLAGEKTLCTDE